ncbi:DNA-binding response regulator [Rhizocola hellebori]|uniref:DNA-binding response regulator n=1 Tax=Rhizocola hellebori TaxID=1392758 RepID=A0A8J3VLF1_9ACTN|nr:response regulator transcription factor [Rhizocola hellebori]GIH10587.1 DNA-binding response regulator [Rhizocola hellebori]
MVRILVVDDEPRICRFVSRALERDGHAVTVAGTGAEAIRLAAEEDYALVVLDLILPGLSGLDVLKAILAEQPGQRVLMLSAIGDVATKVECFRHGAVDYLAKPFAVAELVARVRIRAAEPPAVSFRRWLNAGPVSLDLQRRTATVDGRHIELSQREFVLLHHLMQRADRVCRREDLLAEVWGYTFDTSSNVLDVYIRRLRAKLDPNCIETVRNAGYCFTSN